MSHCHGLCIALVICALQPHLLHALSSPQPSSYSSRRTQRVIVVGAGVGGLATAARIKSTSPTNTDVIILEKNSREKVGGRCGSFDVTIDHDDDNNSNNKGGGCMTFRHERGPSLLLLKDEYEQLFQDCGKRKVTSMTTTAAQEYGLQMKQCIPAYQVVFDDGETISVGFPRSKCNNNNDLSLEQIKQIQILEQESISKINNLEPNGFEKWSSYLDTCAAFLDCGLPNFIEERIDVSTLPAFMIEALKENAIRWPLQPHSSMLDNLFESPNHFERKSL